AVLNATTVNPHIYHLSLHDALPIYLQHLRAPLPALAEREKRADADEDRRADGEQRVDDDVALRTLRVLRQIVGRRLRQQQEKRVEAAEETAAVRTVELGVLEAHRLESLHALVRLGDQLVA